MSFTIKHNNLDRKGKIILLQALWDMAVLAEQSEKEMRKALSEFVNTIFIDSHIHVQKDSLSESIVNAGDKILGGSWFGWLFYECDRGAAKAEMAIDDREYIVSSITDLAELILPGETHAPA